jgi:hypothetical protein
LSFCQPSSVMVILLPSLSCRSLYSPCVGGASFNHVDHPPVRSLFPPSACPSRFSHRLCTLCLLLAVARMRGPVDPSCGRSRRMWLPSTLFRRRAPASTAATGPLASLFGAVALAARAWRRVGSVSLTKKRMCASLFYCGIANSEYYRYRSGARVRPPNSVTNER